MAALTELEHLDVRLDGIRASTLYDVFSSLVKMKFHLYLFVEGITDPDIISKI